MIVSAVHRPGYRSTFGLGATYRILVFFPYLPPLKSTIAKSGINTKIIPFTFLLAHFLDLLIARIIKINSEDASGGETLISRKISLLIS